jgi:hypothetical protein
VSRLPDHSGTSRPPPSSLSHYTNLSGLMGIIDNGEIWASNVSFLNDRRELLYGLDVAAKVVKRFSSKETYADWHKPLVSATHRLKAGQIPDTYAACFCEKSDLLSQWRGYGGSEQAIAITFDTVKLAATLKGPLAILLPVVYGQIRTASEITQALSEKLRDLGKAASVNGRSRDDKQKKANSLISGLLPQFKHSGFKDEKEWRIVIQHSRVGPFVSFRAKGNVMVPYLKLKLRDNHGKLPIKYIRIGPGRDEELTKRSMELYLAGKGYGWKCAFQGLLIDCNPASLG